MRTFITRALLARPVASFATRNILPATIRLSSTTTTSPASETTITRNASPATPEASPARRYAIGLTPSNNYAVYPHTKAAGQSKFTLIKHVDGDKRAFIQDLIDATGIPREDIVLQPVTGHVQVKGFRVEELKKWMTETFGQPPRVNAPISGSST